MQMSKNSKVFATKDDLKRFATKDDLKRFATKDDLKRFATKEDFKIMETELRGDIANDLKSMEARLRKTLLTMSQIYCRRV